MLIRGADIFGHGLGDVRIVGDHIAEIGAIGTLTRLPEEVVIEAGGGALLPGLHDHHIHLAALAARGASVLCGPPAVIDASGLQRALRLAGGTGWLRGIGYHESVLGGLPDAATLDRIVADQPVRLQHRSGRMWLLNGLALERLLASAPPPKGLERDGGRYTGRLFDEDAWLQRALGSAPPDFAAISALIASYGITGITDMSVRNDPVMGAHFTAQRRSGSLRQRCLVAGALSLTEAPADDWQLGPAKLHLHEAALPDFTEAVAFARAAHSQHRAVAVHCVSEVEQVFALAVLQDAGVRTGDRIEHVSVASPELLDVMARLGLHACTQPAFVHERGDRYLADVEPRHHPDLYRLQGLLDRGIPLAGGSDAPYASADPWTAMAAAVSRRTARGTAFSLNEALDPDEALALYLADPDDLASRRTIAVDAAADLCLLDRPWKEARLRLTSDDVVMTFVAGQIVHQRVDQPPGERLARPDPAA